MRTRRRTWIAGIALACCAALATAAPPPERMNFQGVLRDASGNPFNGAAAMTFRFFDSNAGCPGGGTLLLTDSHASVTAIGGLFTAVLGSGTVTPGTASGLNAAFHDNAEVWVEVEVGVGGETLCPRVRVESAAYAQVAGGLRTLENVGIGTTDPNRPLTVGANPSGDTIQLLSEGAGGSDWHLSFTGTGLEYVETGVAGGRLVLEDGGNVGIGTTNPGTRLDVAGTIRAKSGGIVFPDGTLQTTAADNHLHAGEDIVSGTVAEPRIDELIARDAEIGPEVLAALADQDCPVDRAIVGFDSGGQVICSQGGCPVGETDCGGFCVDVDVDENNCGECNNACGASSICNEGSCEPFPNVIDNTVRLEIAGTIDDDVVVVYGPAVDIERIAGFPADHSGPNLERDIIFEYNGPSNAALQLLHDNFVNSGTTQAASIIVEDLTDTEVFRWNLLSYGLSLIEPGEGGRNRYTLTQTTTPDNALQMQDGLNFSTGRTDTFSCNPATDTRLEINGVLDAYAVVVDDPVARTLTVTLDYVEGGGLFTWVDEIARLGTGLDGLRRRSLSVIQDTSPCSGNEAGRTNYFEIFPIRYENFTGFGQAIKIKERVVIAYALQEPA